MLEAYGTQVTSDLALPSEETIDLFPRNFVFNVFYSYVMLIAMQSYGQLASRFTSKNWFSIIEDSLNIFARPPAVLGSLKFTAQNHRQWSLGNPM